VTSANWQHDREEQVEMQKLMLLTTCFLPLVLLCKIHLQLFLTQVQQEIIFFSTVLVPTQPIHVTLPDGTTICSSHAVSQLLQAAIQGHLFPDLCVQALLSMGTFCDDAQQPLQQHLYK
jgi:hypothetical protein